jgi:SAM-dependent methyltransferase
MNSRRARVHFLIRMARAHLRGTTRECPYCAEAADLVRAGRKRIIPEILRCPRCHLVFRFPPDTAADNRDYYERLYWQAEVTDPPSDEALVRYRRDGFPGNLNFAPKLTVLRALRPTGRVLDFGCSWGYGVRQLLDAGYEARGFERSRRRAGFGRAKLGVEILDDDRLLSRLPDGSFDVIFSNHVIEHLPSLGESFDGFTRLLAPGGLLFAVIPNFTGRAARAGLFWNWIGRDHPIAPDREFLAGALREHGFAEVHFASGPFGTALAETIAGRRFDLLDTEGDELLILATAAPRDSSAWNAA